MRQRFLSMIQLASTELLGPIQLASAFVDLLFIPLIIPHCLINQSMGAMNFGTTRGMTRGTMIMFFFSAIWLLLGLYGGRPSAISLRVALFTGWDGVSGIDGNHGEVVHASVPRCRAASREQAALSQQNGRRFGLITGLEGGAIFLAVVVLNAVHRPQFIAPVLAIIVGLHFLPLASLFGRRVYYATGSLGCVIGITGLLIPDPALRASFVGLSFGSLLWLTVAAMLVKYFSMFGDNRRSHSRVNERRGDRTTVTRRSKRTL